MWVGSLLTVGTNVKIRGLASESPGETYEICKKLDFQPCQGFLALFFVFHIYLIRFDKLPAICIDANKIHMKRKQQPGKLFSTSSLSPTVYREAILTQNLLCFKCIIHPLSSKIIGSDYWITTNKFIRKIPIGTLFMLKSERRLSEYQLLLKGCAFSFIYTEFT